jgi:hypothetical protein
MTTGMKEQLLKYFELPMMEQIITGRILRFEKGYQEVLATITS